MHDIRSTNRHPEKPRRGFWNETVATFLIVVGALVIISFATQLTLSHTSKLTQKQAAAAREELAARTVIESHTEGRGSSATVKYAYLGDPLPAKLVPDEVVNRRTAQSYTRDLGVDPEDTSKHRYETVSYARPTFVEHDGAWYYVEYGIAPKALFDSVAGKKTSFLSRLIPKALADSSASLFSGSGDGYVEDSGAATWAGAHDATTGTLADTAGTESIVGGVFISSKSSTYAVDRTFLPFDTSSIPSTAVILSATLNVYATSTTLAQAGAWDYVTVVQTSQASHTALVTTDFDNVGTTEGIDSGQRKNMKTMTNGSLQAFTLNSTGMSWITTQSHTSSCSATAGITCFGLRSGFDVNNTTATTTNNNVDFMTSETSGTANDPSLAVTYRAGFAFWEFDIF
ncbi:MAG: hypothetical protein ACM3TU_00175 [Bacillota bacterium]